MMSLISILGVKKICILIMRVVLLLSHSVVLTVAQLTLHTAVATLLIFGVIYLSSAAVFRLVWQSNDRHGIRSTAPHVHTEIADL